jgi:hypothetical protein
VTVRYRGRCNVRVQVPGVDKYWFRIKVYDTAADLQRVAAGMCGHSPKSWAGTQGCFHGLDSPGRYLGLMRLSDEYMSPELIIHESVHAAAALARVHYGGTLDLADDVDEREELLAYATDDIAGSLLRSPVLTEAPRRNPHGTSTAV